MINRLSRAMSALFGAKETPSQPDAGVPTVNMDDLGAYVGGYAGGDFGIPVFNGANTGTKYPGDWGPVVDFIWQDFYVLRTKSAQLFYTNPYARGMISRYVTNVINTGLTLESEPIYDMIDGLDEPQALIWTDQIEQRMQLWSSTNACDWYGEQNFGRLQASICRQSLVEGDVLVINHVGDDINDVNRIELIGAQNVIQPLATVYDGLPDGETVVDGVRWDRNKREIGYYVQIEDPEFSDGATTYVPAYSQDGRRIAKLVRGFDSLRGGRRGEPLLSVVLMSLKELDRYRDAAVRKAALNAILAMFVEKTEDKPGTNPLGGGAIRKDTIDPLNDELNNNVINRKTEWDTFIPGLLIKEMQQGEKPVVHGSGAEVQYGPFEEAIISGVAWALEVPPEILKLAFSSNYSASQAATNEFKIFLNKQRAFIADEALSWLYADWLITEALADRLPRGADLLTAWRSSNQYDFLAWVQADWSGAIKPSTDLRKAVQGYKQMVDEGFIDRDRASRELNGVKYSKVIRRLRRQNEELANALEPIMGLSEQSAPPSDGNTTDASALADVVADAVVDAIDATGD